MRLRRGGIPWCGEGEEISLSQLHRNLSTDNPGVRARIDSHLLGPVLDRNDTFHYHNLPDLTRFFRNAITTGTWNDNMVSCIMQSTFVNQKKNKVCTGPNRLTERTALINTLHGLLLGLYPYNTKHMTWDHRAKIVKSLREAMLQKDFVQKNYCLIQLSVSEYLNNVIPDFCPVEEQLLERSNQLRFSINQQCEQFRVMSASIILDESPFWTKLNNLAESCFSPIVRLLKTHQKKLVKSCTTSCKNFQKFDTIMQFPRIMLSSTPMAQLSLLYSYMSFEELQSIESIMGCINISMLPKDVVEKHTKLLENTGGCSIYQKSKSHLHVCFPCAMRYKSKLDAQKFAYNCKSEMVQCSTCSAESICVNMIGRVLTVKGVSYYLCTGCLKLCTWKDCIDLCSACKPSTSQKMDVCIACTKRTYEIFRQVIDIDCLQIVDIPLCFKHSKNFAQCHNMVFDMYTFMKQLQT